MKNGITKIKALIIFVIVTVVLLIGYGIFSVSSVLKEKRELAAQVGGLLKQKAALENDLFGKNSELKTAKEKLKPLEEELLQIKKSLEDKTLQETKLKNQLTQLQSDIRRLNEKIGKSENTIKELNGTLKVTKAEKSSLKKTNRRLENDFSVAAKKLNRAQELIQLLKGRLSEIKKSNAPLRKKALELSKDIDLKEGEIAKLKQEEASLKEGLDKIKSLNEQVIADSSKQFKDQQDKLLEKDNQITELISSKANLTEQLQGINTKLGAFMNDNNYLAKQVSELDISKKSLESGILDTKTALAYKEQELKQKIQDLENMNKLYNDLETQLPKISNILAQKEVELDSSSKDKAALKVELMTKNQEYQDLQTELNLARQQQKKMIDELNKAATINTSLQQSLVGLSQSMTQEEENKEKAQDLKKKVEVILTPQEEGR